MPNRLGIHFQVIAFSERSRAAMPDLAGSPFRRTSHVNFCFDFAQAPGLNS